MINTEEMTKELRWENIENYTKQLAEQLIDRHFRFNDRITGPELRNFAKIDQVNLFLIKALFDQWQTETERFKSLYFNFHNPEVREAFRKFQNTLSRNIDIAVDDFRPLLLQSIKQSLILAIDPFRHFEEELKTLSKPGLSMDVLKNRLKYYSFHRNLFQQALDDFNNALKSEILAGELLKEIAKAARDQRHSLRNEREALEEFNELMPVRYERLVVPNAIPDPHQEEENTDFVSFEVDYGTKGNSPTLASNFSEVSKENPQKAHSNKLEVNASASEQTTPRKARINDLHQKPSQGVRTDIAQKQVQSFKKSISLNEKFMIINELFKGDNQLWEEACKDIDHSENYHQALGKLNKKYATRFNWNMNSKRVIELLDHVEKNFERKSA